MAVITERILNNRRHTLGYVIDGGTYTRTQAIKMAREGKIVNAKVARGVKGPHLISTRRGESLYRLPTRVMEYINTSTTQASKAAAKSSAARSAKVAAKTTSKPRRSRGSGPAPARRGTRGNSTK